MIRPLAAAVPLLAAAVAAAPASAATTPGNPQVLQINPTTGTAKVLAGGSPWTTLGGIAVGPTGTLYVANQGPGGPNPQGAGIYSLTAPGYAITPVATTAPTQYPTGLVLNGATLYSLDGTSVVSMGTAPPYTQGVLSTGSLYAQYGVTPVAGALSGTTLYTAAWSSCDSAEGGGAYVIAVNTTNGAQSVVKSLGCAQLGGIAVEKAGTLLISEPSTNTVTGGPSAPPQIIRLNPSTGVVTTLSSGGSLKSPQGIALDGAGDLYVADSTAGVIAVSGSTGQQSPIADGGPLGGATGIALNAAGSSIYVTEAGVPPTITASAARRQRWSSSGIAFTAGCNRTCTVAYDASIAIPGSTGFSQDAAFHTVTGRRSLRIKLPEQVNSRISRALRRHKTVTATVVVTPQDPSSGASGTSTKLRVRLVR